MTKFYPEDRVNFRGNDPITWGTVETVTEDGQVEVTWDDGWSDGHGDLYNPFDLVRLESGGNG